MLKNKYIKYIIYAIIVIILIYFLEWYGVVGIIIFLLSLAIYRIYQHREFFMSNLRVAEVSMFGKPLDKEAWKKGEMKQHKVKFVWRKDKHGKKTNPE